MTVGNLYVFMVCWWSIHSISAAVLELMAFRPVEIGRDFTAKCSKQASDGDATTITDLKWFKDSSDTPLTNIGRIQVFLENEEKQGSVSRLLITDLVRSDSGQYICRGMSSDGEMLQANDTLIVFKSVTFASPTAEQHPIDDGKQQDARVNCTFEGDEPVRVIWYRDRQKLKEPYFFENDGRVLVIPKFVKDRDDGLYSCSVMQDYYLYFAKQTINVTAYQPAKISSAQRTYYEEGEGNNVSLECLAHGAPNPSITWYKVRSGAREPVEAKEGKRSFNSQERQVLTLTDLTTDDQGDYVCVASNDVLVPDELSLNLKVTLKPEIESPKEELLIEGTTVQTPSFPKDVTTEPQLL